MSVSAVAALVETRRRGVPTPAPVTSPVEFRQHHSGARLAVVGPVKYWLAWMLTIDESVEVVLTAEAGGHLRRIGRWVRHSPGHDDAHILRLVRRYHARMLVLSCSFRPVRTERETWDDAREDTI